MKAYTWKWADTGQLVSLVAFTTKELARQSMAFSCHKLEEKPQEIQDEVDENNQPVEVWRVPSKIDHGIAWKKVTLCELYVCNEVEHL